MMKVYIKAAPNVTVALQELLQALFVELQVEGDITKIESLETLDGELLFYEIKEVQNIEELQQMGALSKVILLMHGTPQQRLDLKGYDFLNIDDLKKNFADVKDILSRVIIEKKCTFKYNSGFMNFDINPNRILYIESYHHDVYLHTTLMKFKIRDALKNYVINNAYIKLVQVHKSFVVNIAFIKEIQMNQIILKNDEKILLGEHYKEH